MKFARLYLKAFGSFTDRVLDLPATAGCDLQVIFGRNEAGKSTVLRAVTAFLFGIPERTSDAFRHDYAALRVGATLLLPDGTRFAAMRRKARKATLFPIDEAAGVEVTDTPLPEGALGACLGGLDVPLYQSLFGLDLDGLVRGSDELLRGEGEVGRSLFQAAAGLASLRTVMANLDDEAAAAFKARGSTGRLNRALAQYDEQRRALKAATVYASAWETAEREARQAAQQHAERRAAWQDRRAEEQRLQRIRANLPLATERAAKRDELEALAGVPDLPPEAGESRATALGDVRSAEEARRKAQARLSRLEADRAALVVHHELLAQADAIAEIFRTAERYRAAHEALPGLRRDDARLAEEVAAALAAIGATVDIVHADALLPSETLVARVQARAEEHGLLIERDRQLAEQMHADEVDVARRRAHLAQLSAPVALDALEAAITGAANVGAWEQRRRELDAELTGEEERLGSEVAALWPGSLADLLALTVPLPQMVTSFERDFAVQVEDERRTDDKDAELARDLDECGRELRTLAATGEVITHAEVATARAERDRRWREVRHTYLDTTPEPALRDSDPAPARRAAAAVETALREADHLADLLHADTERVTKVEAIRQRIAAMHGELQRGGERRAVLAGRRRELEARWGALVAPLRRAELSPAALREWLGRQQRVAERHAHVQRLQAERAAVAADVARARSVLDVALGACGLPASMPSETGAALLVRAQQAVGNAQRSRAVRQTLADELQGKLDDIDRQQHARARLAEALCTWQHDWRDATAALHLAPDALPGEVRVRLEQLSRLSAALAARRDLAPRLVEQAAIVDSFEAQVARVVAATGWSGHEQGADARAETLHRALAEARTAFDRHQQLARSIGQEMRTIDEEAAATEAARARLAALVRDAGCELPEELPAIEAQAVRKRVLMQRLVAIDEDLLRLNARTVDEVLAACAGATLDGVDRALAEARDAIGQLDSEVETAQLAALTAGQRLDAIDGGTAAAEMQQALQGTATLVVGEARAYARARLASAVLGRVVQRYREQHQGPLLTRAAEVFARITLGSFSGLAIDHLDDRQVLLGVRPDAARVAVAGMSQGTRDQLFLSLRIAAIEQHIAGRGAFPVIVDDLLVQFDDQRALATLDVLAELGARTQVLFFTHHGHLVDLVARSPLAARVGVHAL